MIQDLDEARIARLETLLGAERLGGLLGVLAQRLEHLAARACDWPDAADDVRFLVHQSLGSARSLGLAGLAEGLDALEQRLDGEGGVTAADLFVEVGLCAERFAVGARLIEVRFKS